ncbi:MAG TPA: sigma 54-interacting transcriptional regulator, partial [Pirellulales bacterium]
MKTARLLIVDADTATAALYRQALSGLDGVELVFERDTAAARRQLEEQSFNLLIAAHAPPRVDGLALLARGHEIDADLPVILREREPALATATSALRLGASDYLTGPLVAADLAAAAARLLGGRRLEAEYELLRRQIERPYSFDDIIGASAGMRKVFDTIQQVADSDVDVLVHGETGTGKELIARSLHRRSHRSEGPFVPVDCGAIPENLLESEFFGHEKGAFTGADSRRIGLLEFADHGTFFLDELGELP